jgi:hypothetical protein
MRAPRPVVGRGGGMLLAASGLTVDEHRDIAAREPADQVVQLDRAPLPSFVQNVNFLQ